MYYEIDNGIRPIVEKVNYEYDIRTSSSCSGILSEHYDLNEIEKGVPYNQLKSVYGQPPRGYMLMKRPILFAEPFMHGNFNGEKVEVDIGFYRDLLPSLSVPSPKYLRRDIEWQLDVDGLSDASRNDSGEKSVNYVFQLTLQSRRNIVLECQSYEQYDRSIEHALESLEDAIDTTLN